MSDEQQKSGLPPLVEVIEAVTMKIITVNTRGCPGEVKETTLQIVENGGRKSNIVASIIRINDPRVQGFMPSKVWWNEDYDAFDILFYVNSTMPKAVRPFKDNTYLMCVYPRNRTIEYDVNIRLFLDQIKTPAGMAFVFMFGDEAYSSIVAAKKEDKSNAS